MMMKRGMALLVMLLLQGYSQAQSGESASAIVQGTDQERRQQNYKRLCAFEPNTAIYRKAEDDEDAIRVHYSFRYSLRPRDHLTGDCETGAHGVYFTYTGEFDFYVFGARPSSPVINRISNPAFHYRNNLATGRSDQTDGWRQSYWGLGLEHRSTGQVTEVTAPEDQARAEQAYQVGDRGFFDGISRGSDYVSLELKFEENHDAIWIKAKAYVSKDSSVTWGPLKNSGVSISDYDRARFIYKKTGVGLDDSETVFSWTIGDKGLPTDSFDVDHLLSRKWAIPLYVKYHHGPMYVLSDYTRAENFIGIGLKLVP